MDRCIVFENITDLLIFFEDDHKVYFFLILNLLFMKLHINNIPMLMNYGGCAVLMFNHFLCNLQKKILMLNNFCRDEFLFLWFASGFLGAVCVLCVMLCVCVPGMCKTTPHVPSRQNQPGEVSGGVCAECDAATAETSQQLRRVLRQNHCG